MGTRQDLQESLRLPLASYDPRNRYLIGVSGGRDSVALLHLLVEAGFRRLIVCHLDHGLRGPASRGDALFVRRLAARLQLDFEVEKANVPSLAAATRQSVETAARDARYAFFGRVARRSRCGVLFLAHHADDQVETFFFNLFRGAGAAGLAAMRPETVRLYGKFRLRIVRPLLAVWRSEIDECIREKKWRFREDASNRETVNLRNKMRHEIIPLLESHFGRGIKRSVWRSAEILGAENEWMASLVEAGTGELSLARLRAMPLPLLRRLLHAWLKNAGVPCAGFAEAEAVLGLLAPGCPHAKINLPGGFHARRRDKKLFVE
jgi:tRNA(Ile)-lysidine synthase